MASKNINYQQCEVVSSSTMENSFQNRKKHKPPSKKLRDAKRAKVWRDKVIQNLKINKTKEVSRKSQNFSKKIKCKFWRTRNNKKEQEISVKEWIELDDNVADCDSVLCDQETNVPDSVSKVNLKIRPVNPMNIYNNIELNMQLSRLEETSILNTALRHIVRLTHDKGSLVAFPQLEAVDRIQLKSVNLPTETECLLVLLSKVFARRSEHLDLDKIYGQYVRMHGRTVIDPKKPWPDCLVFTRHP